MKIFPKKKAGHQLPERLITRVSKIPTSELIMWAESSLPLIGRNLAGSGALSTERVNDALQTAEALYIITLELKKRDTNAG